MKEKDRKALESVEKEIRGMTEQQATRAIGEHAVRLIAATGDVSTEALIESLSHEAQSGNDMTRLRAEKAISDLRSACRDGDNPNAR
ncbi:hypothetical protein [Salinisphaera orenii]|uniref:hypothetical protein n=1 Tax=Salinisphaera orenii TaxID=856731 RepID=UPI0011CDA78C|nr:hypothetical protein [Salinisphaera halophila]